MLLIMVPPKRVDPVLRVLQRHESARVQAIRSKPPLEQLDHGVGCRLATTTDVENHPVGISPEVYRGTGELRTIVAVDSLRHATLEAEAIKGRRNLVSAKARANINGQTLALEDFDHRQCLSTTAIRELVGHRINALGVVVWGRRSLLLAVHRHDVASGPLAAKGEAFFGVETVEVLCTRLPSL